MNTTDLFRLDGRTALVTGAGSGIGRAASLLFTREGARLIAVDRSEAVKETVELVTTAETSLSSRVLSTRRSSPASADPTAGSVSRRASGAPPSSGSQEASSPEGTT